MRASLPILLFLMLLPQTLHAAEQRTDECGAPDSKHYVALIQPEGVEEYRMEIRSVDVEKPLFSRLAGGYENFKAATSPTSFRCLWSPDSKFVAIFERGTKRSGNTTIYFVDGDKVQEVALPDLMLLIRPHLTAEMRSSWVRPEVWLPDHELILSVQGSQMDEEHANFRFILNLRLHIDKTGKLTAETVSLRQDRSIEFSIK